METTVQIKKQARYHTQPREDGGVTIVLPPPQPPQPAKEAASRWWLGILVTVIVGGVTPVVVAEIKSNAEVRKAEAAKAERPLEPKPKTHHGKERHKR